jgi:hypothetical protein
MQKIKARHSFTSFAALFILSAFVLSPVHEALAQVSTAVAIIQIARVDISQFPDVQVQAIIRDVNNNPVPTADLQNLELVEKVLDKEAVVSEYTTYKVTKVSPGLESMFVLDYGGDLSQKGATGTSRIEEMKAILHSYFRAMNPSDTAGITVISGSNIQIVQPLTSDTATLNASVDKLPPVTTGPSQGVNATNKTLAELLTSPNYGSVIQTVILLSSQLYDETGVLDAVEKAKADRIAINTILVRDIPYSFVAQPLKTLAADTFGIYTYYNGQASLQKDLYPWIAVQHTQALLSYRSTFGDSSDRTIELRTKGTGSNVISSSKNFQVNLFPPAVQIDTPANNEEIKREAKTYDQGMSSLDSVEPTNETIIASVDFPDNFKRKITQAQLFIDGVKVGNPLEYPGAMLNFSWDLRQYRQQGTEQHELKVQVVDELGLENTSDATLVKITVIIPSLSGVVSTSVCKDKKGFGLFTCQVAAQARYMVSTPSGWISIGSLLVAVAAIVLAFRFKGQIAQAGGAAYDVVRETITRLTRPISSEAGAYLEVLRGDDDLKGKSIPLYMRTVTPAGRSPQEAELVFDLGNDRSVVSRRHCEFREEDGIFKIRDLGSSHGTYVNGIRLPEGGDGQALADGDKIELGPAERGGVLILFRATPSQGTTENYDDDYKTNPAYSEGALDAEHSHKDNVGNDKVKGKSGK